MEQIRSLQDRILYLPDNRDEDTGEVTYGIVSDAVTLSCACVVSAKLCNQNLKACPVCEKVDIYVIGPCKPLRLLYQELQRIKRDSSKHILTEFKDIDQAATVLHDNDNTTNDNNNDDDISHTNSNMNTNEIDSLLPPITKNLEFFSMMEDQPIADTSNNNISFPVISSNTGDQSLSDIPTASLLSDTKNSSSDDNNTQSLMHLFHTVAIRVNNKYQDNDKTLSGAIGPTKDKLRYDVPFSSLKEEEDDFRALDNASNTRTVPISLENNSSNFSSTNLANEGNNQYLQFSSLSASKANDSQTNLDHILSGNSAISVDEKRELYYAKCFPMYRKRFQFNTHSKFNFIKSNTSSFINTAISPDCTKFALITDSKWEVYSMPTREDRHSNTPQLLFCGKSNGQYGSNYKELKRSANKKLDHSNSHQSFCRLSNDLLVISGSNNQFRVYNLNGNGEYIHSYKSSFPIRCIDIDPASQIIAYGITGKDRNTGAEQALIAFHQISKNKVTTETEFSEPVTVTLPYRDPINSIQLSNDGKFISCSTALESRFLIISVERPKEPRLLMKSLRTIDSSMESEGITDTKLFPGNPNIMCVTSCAFNSPPIVINTRINNKKNGIRTVAQPSMIMRISEFGSQIHKCEISPRNDSIAFLDKNGSVYVMSTPAMMDNEKRRVALVDIVANSHRVYESASFRFSPDGHQLFIIDRKGILYIEDFAAGQPQDLDVTKCKQID
ncbi:hypothetical protein J7294_02919 [Nakaseomyces glabratus]|nr:hypothetical protein J7294_02919 [Nakaseomyces glabratus]